MVLSRIKITKLCDSVILFSIYAIAFFLPISKAIIESFSIMAIVFYLLKKIINSEGLPKTALNLGIFAYMAACVLSMFYSSNLAISARTFFAKTLQDIAFFFVVCRAINEKKKIINVMNVLFLSSLVLGIDGIYQHFTTQDFLRHRYAIFTNRIFASFVTPNAFGCYLSVIVPFIVVSFFKKNTLKFQRALYCGLFILLFVCLLLTASRGAWLAFFGASLFLSIWIHALGVRLLILGIILVIIKPFCPLFVKERLANFFIFTDAGSIDRKFIWRAGWKMFISQPWIGLGLGTFMFNFKKFIAEDYKYTASYAHNCYLQMASELGIIGLLAFLSILWLFFYRGVKALNKGERNFYWYILLASQAAIFGYCVQMGVDTTIYSLDLGMLFWLVLGIGVAALKKLEADSKNKIKQANV